MKQENQDKKPSRRGLFKWLGKMAAGTSVAGIGLSAATPLTAQASTKKARHSRVATLLDKAGNVLIPNCVVCDGCDIAYCIFDYGCIADNLTTPFLIVYTQYYGCVSNRTCPSYQYYTCTSTCSCP